MTALEDIAAERQRQISEEGWAPTHDDDHNGGQMAGAAACYAMHGLQIERDDLLGRVQDLVGDLWPWSAAWWKPTERRRDLVKAGALIVAEIERLDRAPKSNS